MVAQTMTRLTAPFDRASMPFGVARLKQTRKGYQIPWFVDRKAPLRDGEPDFRIMDGARLKLAIRENRCWVCGMKANASPMAFVAGPMCGINRTASEPPAHLACARWSARACPFLAYPKRVRDERDLPPGQMAGIGILRNPGVAMVWVSRRWTTWRPGNPRSAGVLFDLGEPESVEWYCEGREATRTEVQESIETGLPILLRQAAQDGAHACFELGRLTERFMPLLPDETPTDVVRSMLQASVAAEAGNA
jgi:hypothetical protein